VQCIIQLTFPSNHSLLDQLVRVSCSISHATHRGDGNLCKSRVTSRQLTGCFLWEQFAKPGNTLTSCFLHLGFHEKMIYDVTNFMLFILACYLYECTISHVWVLTRLSELDFRQGSWNIYFHLPCAHALLLCSR
jgi:hypothetical protein